MSGTPKIPQKAHTNPRFWSSQAQRLYDLNRSRLRADTLTSRILPMGLLLNALRLQASCVCFVSVRPHFHSEVLSYVSFICGFPVHDFRQWKSPACKKKMKTKIQATRNAVPPFSWQNARCKRENSSYQASQLDQCHRSGEPLHFTAKNSGC